MDYKSRMIQRIEEDASLTPEQKYELKIQYGWVRPEGSIAEKKKPSWLEAPFERLAGKVEEWTGSQGGPVTGAIRMLGGKASDVPSVGTEAQSVLGNLVQSPYVRRMMGKLEAELPGNIIEEQSRLAKATVDRIVKDLLPGGSVKNRQEIVNLATSDPIANALVGPDITYEAMESQGKYSPIFAQEQHLDEDVALLLENAKRFGTKGFQDVLRAIRKAQYKGNPDAIALTDELPTSLATSTLPHEFNHASQDRFGVFLDRILSPWRKDWAHQPIEWESTYVGDVGLDPFTRRGSLADLLATGQRTAVARSAPKDQNAASFNEQLAELNKRLLAHDSQTQMLLQPRHTTDWQGNPIAVLMDKTHAINDPNSGIQQPGFRALMMAILGGK